MAIDSEDKAKYPDSGSSQHTCGHVRCPACDGRRSAMQIALGPALKFSEAATLWLESRRFRSLNARARFIAPATLAAYEAYVRALNRFFADITLGDIHAGHLGEYQQQRINGSLAPAPRQRKDKTEYFPHESSRVSPHKVNQELGLLQM